MFLISASECFARSAVPEFTTLALEEPRTGSCKAGCLAGATTALGGGVVVEPIDLVWVPAETLFGAAEPILSVETFGASEEFEFFALIGLEITSGALSAGNLVVFCSVGVFVLVVEPRKL
jgi:hypothetical protein